MSKAETEFIQYFSAKNSVARQMLRGLELINYVYKDLNRKDKDKIWKLTSSEKKEATEAEKQKREEEVAAIKAKIKEREESETRMKTEIAEDLRPTWEELSAVLSLLEKRSDSKHTIIALQDVVESFFLCYSMIIPSAESSPAPPTSPPQTTQQDDATNSLASIPSSLISTETMTDTVGAIKSLPAATHTAIEPSKYQKEMFDFAEKHRFILNHILRGNAHSLESSAFAILTHFPKLLDFDVKRKYFYKELKKIDSQDRNRYEDIAIRVRRSHIFGDSFRELHRLRPNDWKARYYIMFEGEEGQDAGGLLREWYQVITREIFNPNYALFINAPGDRVTYMINKSSYINPEHLEYFKFVGRLMAKAIRDNKQLDCYFTRAFYKHILNIHVRYQDIESEDPAIYKSFDFLLNNSVEDLGSELTFCVEVEEFGVRSTRQLKEGGHKTIVTDANKQEYIQLMCQMKMTGSIRQQLNAFLEGFYELIPKKLIAIFNEQELELLISGLPEINIDDLCANTEYKNYTRTSPQIQWFWHSLRSFSREDTAKFLQFVTGTSKVPLQGFAHLEGMNGTQKFTIQKDTRSPDRLPSAHTCFNQLDLPEYPNQETLQKMLLLACRECTEGFAFA